VKTIVLGLGNPIWGDDSAGYRIARAVSDGLIHQEVTVQEASIAGLDILELLADYNKAIIIDAIQSNNGQPGTIYRLELDDIASNHVTSPHSIDFITALKLGRKLGLPLPESVTIFAIEVGQTTFPRGECTPAVRAAIPICADIIIRELRTKARKTTPAVRE
jgi:hydrogenase maturation protease